MVFRVVVGVRNAKPFIEAVLHGMKLEPSTEVPFAHSCSSVATFLEHLWQQPLLIGQPIAASVIVGALHAKAVRIAPC